MPIVTLTTDFGVRDPFAGIMKGVVLGICRDVQIVDLTHDIAPQDVLGAALTLEAAVAFFPPGTVHVAVVDPGVGSARRGMAARAGDRWFVGPDNGVFTFALREGGWTAVSLEEPALQLPRVSRTFHGRDVFAPAAAHLASGVPLARFGPPLRDPVRLPWPSCRREGNVLVGEVIGTDRFGNLLTSVTAEALQGFAPRGQLEVVVAGIRSGGLVSCYAEGEEGVPNALVGSTGRVEIFLKNGNAAGLIGAGRGAPVRVRAR